MSAKILIIVVAAVSIVTIAVTTSFGGATRPNLLCAGLSATIVGTTGPDRIVGTPGDDVIVGLDGNDRINGAGGNDLICGSDGNDTIDGGAGHNRLYGGRGSDRVSRGDSLHGGPGIDYLGVPYLFSGRQDGEKCLSPRIDDSLDRRPLLSE